MRLVDPLPAPLTDDVESRYQFLAETALKAASTKASASLQAAVGDASAASSVASPAALLDGGAAGVWAGVRSLKAAGDPSKKRQLRMSGVSNTPALHLVARVTDPAGSGVSVARTLFLSNGRAPHHWQHRVFSDGEVFDPIVEDDLPQVDRSDETIRYMTLYGILAAAASAAAAGAAGGATPPSNESLTTMLQEKLRASGLLPPKFDVNANASLTLERVLAPGAPAETTASAAAPPHWYLHVVCARLDAVPSGRWAPDSEGSLVFEETYALDGRGGWSALTGGVPLLQCWPAEGAEETESRQVRAGVSSLPPTCPAHSAHVAPSHLAPLPLSRRCAAPSAQTPCASSYTSWSRGSAPASTTCCRCSPCLPLTLPELSSPCLLT